MKCCKIGTFEHDVPMPIKGRVRYVDYCVADIIAALNAANIVTLASCCGHGEQNGNILLEDGRELIVKGAKKKRTISKGEIILDGDCEVVK